VPGKVHLSHKTEEGVSQKQKEALHQSQSWAGHLRSIPVGTPVEPAGGDCPRVWRRGEPLKKRIGGGKKERLPNQEGASSLSRKTLGENPGVADLGLPHRGQNPTGSSGESKSSKKEDSCGEERLSNKKKKSMRLLDSEKSRPPGSDDQTKWCAGAGRKKKNEFFQEGGSKRRVIPFQAAKTEDTPLPRRALREDQQPIKSTTKRKGGKKGREVMRI